MPSYCDIFGFLHDSQYAFRKKRGTERLLEDFSDYVAYKLDRNKFILALFLDLAKAFETRSQYILNKTRSYEFQGFL